MKTKTMRYTARVIFGSMRILPVLLALLLPVSVPAQFDSTTTNGAVTISGYNCSDNVVIISNKIAGLPVIRIEQGAFLGCTNLMSVAIPSSVISIGENAFMGCGLTNVTIGSSVTNLGWGVFYNCTSLTGVYFLGNAPSIAGSDLFFGATNVTVYYLSGSTGWAKTFGGRPTAVWTGKSP